MQNTFRQTTAISYSRAVATDQLRPTWTPPGWSGLVGVARADITPPVGIRMRNWGYGDEDVSTGVHRPITISVLALQSPDEDVTLIATADLGWWRTVEDERQVRDAVLSRTGLDDDALLLHLTHTHAGPSICREDSDLPGGEGVGAYLDFVSERAAFAAAEAIERLAEATVVWATGTHGLASVRDVVFDGRALLGYNPREMPDTTVLAGRVSTSDGTVIATIVNYACHPTSLGYGNSKVSPDYVGAMREEVESAYSAPCLFLQGASGELGPKVQYTDDTDVTDAQGRGLGLAVVSILSTLPSAGAGLVLSDVIQSGAPLAIWAEQPGQWPRATARATRAVAVEIKPLPSIAELEVEWSDIDPRSRAERLRRATRLRRTYADMDNATHPVWAWRWGDVIFVAHPGEAYSLLQSSLRSRFPGVTVVVMNLTNGPGWVYLPPESAYVDNRYQAWQTILQPGSLERVIEAATSAMVELGAERIDR